MPLRRILALHEISTAFERGWSTLGNGELLAAAESEFELLITTDRNLKYQQRLAARRLAILVLPSTSWPRISRHLPDVERAVASIAAGEYRELEWSD